MTLPGNRVDTHLPLAVWRVGEERRPGHAFAMIHGFGGSSFTWKSWAPRLAQRSQVFTIDLMGFGAAPKPADATYEPGEQARLVEAFLIEQGIDTVTLIGHSMGGGISLLTAIRLLESPRTRADALVLVAAAAYPQRLPPFVGFSRHPKLSSALARSIGPRRIVAATLKSIVYDKSSVTEEQISAYTEPLTSAAGLFSAMASGRSILPPDLERTTARYPELTMPVLALWGDHDRVIPLWVGKRLAEEIPNGELVVLPRCGHVPPEERAEESLRVVEDFLTRRAL